MMLTSYAKAHGGQFLFHVLSEPLNGVYNLLENCEVEILKLSKTVSSEDIPIVLKKNQDNLKTVCNVVFQSIFDNQAKLPVPLMRMCYFLDSNVAQDLPARANLVNSYVQANHFPKDVDESINTSQIIAANRSLGILTQSQKVVGAFLFLRFLVPGMHF